MTWHSWLIPPLITSIFFELGILLLYELIVKIIIDHQVDYDHANRLIGRFTAGYLFILYLLLDIAAVTGGDQVAFANFRLIILFTMVLFLESLPSRISIGLALILELLVYHPIAKMISQITAIFLLLGLSAYIHRRLPRRSFLTRTILSIIAGAIFWGVIERSSNLSWSQTLTQFLFFTIQVTILIWAIVVLERTNKLALLNSRYAKYDALTGVRNLRFFRDEFDKEIIRSRRSETPLVLIAVDIDHFKHINDTYGHLAGDAVLKQVTTRLIEITSKFNRDITIYRVGGEEFNILVPNADTYQGAQIATQCRQELSAAPVQFGDKIIPVTLSLGVADLIDEDTSLTLYNRADQNLYLSKGRGRNLVTVNFKTLTNETDPVTPPETQHKTN